MSRLADGQLRVGVEHRRFTRLGNALDAIAADRLEQLITDAIAHRTRAERGLEL